MSRKLGAFDPASTATTTVFSISTGAGAAIAAVAQNMFPLSTDLSNTGAGDGVLSTLGTVITFSSAVGTPYGAGSAMRIQDSSSTRNKLEITSAAAVEMMEFSSAFTWEWWMWRDSGQNSSHRVLFDSRENGEHSYPVLLIQFSSGGFLRVSNASTGSGSYQDRTAGTAAAEQQWQHFAITRDSSDTLRMFIDGVKVLATSFAFSFDNKATGGRPEFFSDVNVTNNSAHYMRDLRIFKDTCVYTTSFSVPNQPMTATNETLVIATSTVVNTRSHSHVWNYSDIYKARRADTWPGLVYDPQIALYLPFNGSLTDFSSYGHTVSAVGDAAVTTSPFQFHGSCAFDGNGDLLTVPHNDIFDFVGNDFTIEGFINPTTAAGVQGVYAQWGGTGSRSFKVVISTNAKLEINGSKDGSSGGQINQLASTAFELNTFSHFAVTREGSNFRIFINGVNRGTTTDSGALYNSSANIAIGGNRADQTTNTLFGNLEDFRVINGLALYTTDFEVPTRSLNNTLTVNP